MTWFINYLKRDRSFQQIFIRTSALSRRFLLTYICLDINLGNLGVAVIEIFWSKVNIWNVNCLRNSIHFRYTNGCSCESVKVFETENVSTWKWLEPPTFGFMPNALTIWAIRARHLLSHVLNTGSGGIDIFWRKVNIWNVNYARATAFIFDTRTDIFVKVSKFLRQKMCRPERDSNPLPSDSVIEM